MKKSLFKLILILIVAEVNGQSKEVEKTHNIKATFLALSYGYEVPFSQKTTMNLEIALAGGLGSNVFVGDYWAITPIARVEPRYYYNYLKRQQKGKKTLKNSANYLCVSLDYVNGFSIGNATVLESLSILPKWGLRRTIGFHFVFEFAIGIGAEQTEIENWQPRLGLDLKFGYVF